MKSKTIDASDRAVRPPAPPWWPKIEQDYLAAHARRDARLRDESNETGEDWARHQRVLDQGAVLVRQILELIEAESIPAVQEAAVRYLLNRDISLPEAFIHPNELDMLHAADTERNELRPPELKGHGTCLAMGHRPLAR